MLSPFGSEISLNLKVNITAHKVYIQIHTVAPTWIQQCHIVTTHIHSNGKCSAAKKVTLTLTHPNPNPYCSVKRSYTMTL